MKIKIVCTIAVAGLLVGCAETGKTLGGSTYNDQNVLTGGPTMGTTIEDLPLAVKDTLQQKVPKAEISDIKRENMNGRSVYKIDFMDKEKYPPLWIAEDGGLVQAQTK